MELGVEYRRETSGCAAMKEKKRTITDKFRFLLEYYHSTPVYWIYNTVQLH
jgi:hypothetical protein